MSQVTPGERFPNLRLQRADASVELRDRWADGALVVLFMRHFGCAFCREYLHRMSKRYGDFQAAGADVLAIFQYSADATRDYCASRRVPFDCLGDPLREAYAELSLGRGGFRDLLGWRVARRYPRAIRTTGSMGGGAQGGDVAQLPGTFVIAPDGTVAFAHYSASSADNPRVEDVLAAAVAAGR